MGVREAHNEILSIGLFDSMTESYAARLILRPQIGCPHSSAVHTDHKNTAVRVRYDGTVHCGSNTWSPNRHMTIQKKIGICCYMVLIQV